MKPLTEQEIRAAFVNCTKGEAKRLTVPRDLAEQCWDDLDGSPVGVQLRSSGVGSWQLRRSMCSVCVTTHTGGVSLMVAPRSGKAGQQGNSVGVYMCSDLACSLYVRGKKDAGIGARLHESLTLEEKVQRTVANLAAFIAKVTA